MIMELQSADGVRACRNPTMAPAIEQYGAARSATLNERGFTRARDEVARWPGYAPTPLRVLDNLARRFGMAGLYYKDEGERFGLKSFKALGGAYAVYRLLAQSIMHRNGAGEAVSAADILSGRWRDLVGGITVTCATDGNHGRSVAWGAQLFGCRCVIYVHASVSEGRRAAIARYGAEVIQVAGNYDDSVRYADAQAKAHGWTVVSDTTYEGYRRIPIDVMHGYGVMSLEIVEQFGEHPPTHVIVPAGVGALAASVAAAFWLAWGASRPKLIIVEPSAADCYRRSALAGHPVAVTGTLDTVMAGLACGEVSPAAWEIVRSAAFAYVAVEDCYALDAMRRFAKPEGDDPAIVSGETGASGLAVLLASRTRPALRALMELDAESRVLLVGSEGDTDPEIYRQITGSSAAQA